MTTVEILLKMVTWLEEHSMAKNPTEVARKSGLNPVSMSKIRNGKTKQVKQETLRAVNAAYDNVFNPEWLRGESDVMLTIDLAQHSPTIPEQIPDCPGWVSALIAAKEETIAAKKSELAAKDETIATLRDQLAGKDRTIADKDAHIKDIQQQLIDLRAQMAMEKGLLTGRSHSASADPDHRLGTEV